MVKEIPDQWSQAMATKRCSMGCVAKWATVLKQKFVWIQTLKSVKKLRPAYFNVKFPQNMPIFKYANLYQIFKILHIQFDILKCFIKVMISKWWF